MLCRGKLASWLLSVVVASAAWAGGFNGGLGVDLRVEGIVDSAPDPKALGALSIRVGDRLRGFEVHAAQAAGEEGMSIFRGVIQYPENLRLIGSDAVLQPFYEAPPGTRIRVLGIFKPDIRWLLVGEIQVVGDQQRHAGHDG